MNKATDLLSQLSSPEVVEQARALARQIRREEHVRAFMARRALLILLWGLAAMGLCTWALVALLGRPPVSGLPLPLLLLGMTLWLAAVLALVAPLLLWLQRAALREWRDTEGNGPAEETPAH